MLTAPLAGTAHAYAGQGENLAVTDEAAYATRLLVYRPTDADAFNGTVWVEWFNVSAGLDGAPDWILAHTELARSGASQHRRVVVQHLRMREKTRRDNRFARP